MSVLEIGAEYIVRHRRKGTFRMRVVREDETWVTGIITEGGASSRDGWCEAGDEITIRKLLAEFEEVADACD